MRHEKYAYNNEHRKSTVECDDNFVLRILCSSFEHTWQTIQWMFVYICIDGSREKRQVSKLGKQENAKISRCFYKCFVHDNYTISIFVEYIRIQIIFQTLAWCFFIYISENMLWLKKIFFFLEIIFLNSYPLSISCSCVIANNL